MMRVRTILTGGAITLAAGTLVIFWLLWTQQAPPDALLSAGPAATAEVTRGTLLDTKTVTGLLGYGETTEVRRSGSGLLTSLAPEGKVVARGEPLLAIDGLPLIVLYGDVPHYKTLRFKADAATWVELETAISDADTAELTLNLEQARLDDATARLAETELRLADGSATAPQTPEFANLAGAVAAAEAKLQRSEELHKSNVSSAAEVAMSRTEFANAKANLELAQRTVRQQLATARLDVAAARVAVANQARKLADLRDDLAQLESLAADASVVDQIKANLVALGYTGSLEQMLRAWQSSSGQAMTGILAPDQVMIVPGPIRVAEHLAEVGDTLSDGSADKPAILAYTENIKLVTVSLAVADQALAVRGRDVVITLPDGIVIAGTIEEVGGVVTEGEFEVIVAIPDQAAVKALETASVDVEFISEERADVLSVPVSALLALPDRGFGVELVAGGQTRLVPVKVGMFASGRVELAGDGIVEGARVGVPR